VNYSLPAFWQTTRSRLLCLYICQCFRQIVHAEGLDQSCQVERGAGSLSTGRDEKHWHSGALGANCEGKLHAGDTGHKMVGDKDVEYSTLPDEAERLGSGCCLDHAVVQLKKHIGRAHEVVPDFWTGC